MQQDARAGLNRGYNQMRVIAVNAVRGKISSRVLAPQCRRREI